MFRQGFCCSLSVLNIAALSTAWTLKEPEVACAVAAAHYGSQSIRALHREPACLRWGKSSGKPVLHVGRSGRHLRCSQLPQMPPSRHSFAHSPLSGWAVLSVCTANCPRCLQTRSAGDGCYSAPQERQISKAPASAKALYPAWPCGIGFTSWLGVPPFWGARRFSVMKAFKSGCSGMVAWGRGLSQKGCCGSSSHPMRVAGFLSSRRVMRSSKAALTSGEELT